ncbi:MAG: hypothetical protein ACT4OP_01805 [Actinomycetota bacterium]
MKLIRRIAVAALLVAACDAGGGAPVSGTIEVTAEDYAFAGMPSLVATGAEVTLTNGSSREVHEMVVLRIADGETRTVEELLELPEEEDEGVAETVGFLLALPGEGGINPEAEGATSVPLTAAGRYVLLCFIPQGADPELVAEAMDNPNAEGPPELEGGAPHYTLGMVKEFTVEG